MKTVTWMITYEPDRRLNYVSREDGTAIVEIHTAQDGHRSFDLTASEVARLKDILRLPPATTV